MASTATTTIPWLAGAASKLFLQFACHQVRVDGLQPFVDRIEDGRRGVLTVANHISVIDEPLMWGVLPIRLFKQSKTVRWTLGASDVMFNGRLDSWFFTKGQVIETFRGKGIYQNAIDEASRKLDQGRWVHIFPEGRIKQEDFSNLRRFKWGVSRILFESKAARRPDDLPPWIIPIFIKGFNDVMDEERGFPRPFPRPGKNVTIVIGEPINDVIEPLLDDYRAQFPGEPWRPTTYGRDVQDDIKDEPQALTELRSRVAEVLRQEVMRLGERVEEVEQRPPDVIRW